MLQTWKYRFNYKKLGKHINLLLYQYYFSKCKYFHIIAEMYEGFIMRSLNRIFSLFGFYLLLLKRRETSISLISIDIYY